MGFIDAYPVQLSDSVFEHKSKILVVLFIAGFLQGI